jgi:hypothetical protein
LSANPPPEVLALAQQEANVESPGTRDVVPQFSGAPTLAVPLEAGGGRG